MLRTGKKHFLLAAGMALWFAGIMPAAAQATRGSVSASSYDSHALQLLDRMTAAYAHLTELEQTTAFSTSLLPLTPAPAAEGSDSKKGSPEAKLQRTLRLSFASPNRLRLVTEDGDPVTKQTVVSEWICDGKEFWSYMGDTRTYTREKAPKHIHDFPKLATLNATTLEMTMLIGLNPFAHLRDDLDSVAYAGSESVHNVATDVVVLKSQTDEERTEVRLSIGKDDSLLRRCIIETVPVTAAATTINKVGDALDELETQATSTTPAAPLPMKTRIVYDNTINLLPTFDPLTFTFKIPEGASLFTPQNPHQGLNLTYPASNPDLLQRLKAKGHKRRVLRF